MLFTVKVVKVFAGILLAGALFVPPALASQGGHGHHGNEGPRHYGRFPVGFHRPSLSGAFLKIAIGNTAFFYEEGVYYRHVGRQYVIVDPPLGVVVSGVPSYYQPVMINGVTYYVADDVYYMRVPGGYQVVPRPVVITPTPVVIASVPADTTVFAKQTVLPDGKTTEENFILNIPNDQGGYTQVAIKRVDKGFVGPQGELYAEFPRVVQLQAMYGRGVK